jgi:transcriptional regulator with XRE-family HTH domain
MGKNKRAQPKKLAAKLKEIRSRLEWSQEEMADRLKKVEKTIYPGLISRFEHGKAEPSLLVLLEYSRIAGVLMEALVDDKIRLP